MKYMVGLPVTPYDGFIERLIQCREHIYRHRQSGYGFCGQLSEAWQKIFSKLTYRIAWNFALPLLTGGLFCIALLLHEIYGLVSSVMLLFYGLSLVNVSKFTYSNVAWLGYAFLCLGIADCFFEGHGLLFWTIGFGGFHILYGILFYLQYERKR